MQEGGYSEVASRIEGADQEAWQTPARAPVQRKAEMNIKELLPSPAEDKDPNSHRGANGDFSVYKWYFKAIGGENFVVFIILCMLFVLGVIYPRKMTLAYPPTYPMMSGFLFDYILLIIWCLQRFG